MSEKVTFLRIWEREFRTTVRVLKAFPPEKIEEKPHERSRTVGSLAWQCATDERVISAILDDENDLRNVPPGPPMPGTMEEIVAAYEAAHREAFEKMSLAQEEEFTKTVTVLLRGGQIDLPRPDAIWGNLMDEVHHRGQLTVYLRLAGGKVPSIYGPSGDEPLGR